MENESSLISRMCAVTISREYGSGGGEIATRLAKRLGWQLVDHEVVVCVAHELGVTEENAAAHDEQVESLASRFLNSLRASEPMMPALAPVPLTTDTNAYQEARRRVIEAAVITGHVVIVGRGAQVLLASHRDVLHARIIAPLSCASSTLCGVKAWIVTRPARVYRPKNATAFVTCKQSTTSIQGTRTSMIS